MLGTSRNTVHKMAESIFESLLPLNVEHLGSAPVMDYSMMDGSDDDDIAVHWKKFDVGFPELYDVMSTDDLFNELNPVANLNSWAFENTTNNDDIFVNHDCMWAGHCGSKEHAEESNLSCFIPKPPVIKKEMCPPPPPPVTPKQESLLKPSVKAMITSTPMQPCSTIIQHVIQTPPESDDEENKASHKNKSSNILKILTDAINECDHNDLTEDLTELFEEDEVDSEESLADNFIKEEVLDIKDEPEDTESEQEESEHMSYEEFRIRTQMAAENDHSYYKDKNAAMRNNIYGIETPSDSEEDEEIDVVSVSDKFTNASRIALSLPNNPSSSDKHHLQKRVATAMSKKRTNNGIKTILPVRSSDSPSCSTSTPSRRGVKRGRGNRNNSSYKRKRSNVTEGEPTDKRHLHNDMERQRRVDLRIAFENLKNVVPEVSGTKKIAKVNILLQAAQHCYYLTESNVNNIKQLEDLKKKQSYLRSRLSQLRRNLAARR
ncbi:uncharacterized protein [Euwallacea similis]|uniref:uncharacterized protein n=1 Tax=Euwallacea similis TaxID=1736056 RepID=UPI003451106A